MKDISFRSEGGWIYLSDGDREVRMTEDFLQSALNNAVRTKISLRGEHGSIRVHRDHLAMILAAASEKDHPSWTKVNTLPRVVQKVTPCYELKGPLNVRFCFLARMKGVQEEVRGAFLASLGLEDVEGYPFCMTVALTAEQSKALGIPGKELRSCGEPRRNSKTMTELNRKYLGMLKERGVSRDIEHRMSDLLQTITVPGERHRPEWFISGGRAYIGGARLIETDEVMRISDDEYADQKLLS